MRLIRAGLPIVVALAILACGDDGGTAASVTDASSADTAADATADVTPEPAALAFPEGFLWGTAVAGFQVDMGCPTLAPEACEDRNSDWYAYITSEETKASAAAHLSGDPPTAGPGHWELFAEDFRRLDEELHNNSYRFSLEWSRLFPTATDAIERDDIDGLRAAADPAALAGYHAMFDALAARGITPLVTINHYTLPLWLHDGVACHKNAATCEAKGWVDKDRAVTEIAKFGAFAAAEFGDHVDLWATLNEPFAVLLAGYLFPSPTRTNPPARPLAFRDGKIVLEGLVEAHARIYDAIHAHDGADADANGASAEVGVVYGMAPAVPVDPDDPLDVAGAENAFYLVNTVYLDAVALGRFDHDLDGTAEDRADLADRLDWLGVNYYFALPAKGSERPIFAGLSPLTTFDPSALQSTDPWPQGLYELLTGAWERYRLPIIITENGVEKVERDALAKQTLSEHLQWAHRAISEGVDLRGYFYWSLVDNYEWNHGMGLRFGLYAVEPDDPTKARTLRPFARHYGRISLANGLPADLVDDHPIVEGRP